MTDALLFLHLLMAALLFVTVAVFTAYAFGARVDGATLTVAQVCWGVGGVGTLLLGIGLAIDIDGYDPWDTWILIAIVLWFFAYGASEAAERGARQALEGTGTLATKAVRVHWVRTALILISSVLAWLAVRRAGGEGGGSSGTARAAAILVALLVVLNVVAIWAMTTKPV
ncbi:hypothetical protein BH20ACT15_BH20ACT15_09030 [soil metagenome]